MYFGEPVQHRIGGCPMQKVALYELVTKGWINLIDKRGDGRIVVGGISLMSVSLGMKIDWSPAVRWTSNGTDQ